MFSFAETLAQYSIITIFITRLKHLITKTCILVGASVTSQHPYRSTVLTFELKNLSLVLNEIIEEFQISFS